MRHLIIDTDPGIDDALAILLALAAPELSVEALTTVAGNVALRHTTRNALRLRDLAGRPNLPVYAGSERPLRRPPIQATSHGSDGLGGLALPESALPAEETDAVAWLADRLAGAPPASVTLVAIGPLTNLAHLLRRAPGATAALAEVVIMGGASAEVGGNMTPFAEFNFNADPDAAAEVFAAGLPITLVPLDLAYRAPVSPARLRTLLPAQGPAGPALAALFDHYGRGDGYLYDGLAVAWLLWPSLFRGRRAFVEVESGGERAGQSHFKWNDEGDCLILLQCEEDELFARLAERLARF